MAENGSQSREGGYLGAVVVFSAFFIQVIAFGTSQSIGVYNIELLKAFDAGAAAVSLVGSINLGMLLGAAFDAGAAAVSLVGSINLGMLLGAGPICSFLMTKWSHRQVALLGSVLSNVGLIFMPLAPNLLFMYAFYGFLTGLGYSMVYVPSHILSGLYYHKYRSLATGVATAGSGLGSTVFPIIIYQLIQYFGWRGSLLLVAGINLHLFIFSALLRPVPKSLLKSYSMQENGEQETSRLVSENANQKEYVCTGEPNDIAIIEKRVNGAVDLKGTNTDIKVNRVNENETVTDALLSDTEITSNEIPVESFYQRVCQHFKMVFTFDFIIYFLSNIGWNAGAGILLIFLPKYMTSIGLSEENASLAFSIFGAGSCIGCVLGGLLGNIRCCNRIILYIFGNIGAGLLTFVFGFDALHSFFGQICLVLLFGLLFGVILGLLVVVTSDLLGTEALGFGFGYLMLANGIGIFSGPPVAGALIDYLQHLEPAIYLSGGLTTFGGVVMCLVPICRFYSRGSKLYREPSITVTVNS